MKKFRLIIMVVAALAALTAIPASADHSPTGGVAATVTPAFLSVTLNHISIDYGSLGNSEIGEPISNETGDALQECSLSTNPGFTATNNGDIVTTLTIRGGDSFDITDVSETPTTVWTLGSAVAATTYVQAFSTVPGGTTGDCDFSGTVTTGGLNDGPLTIAARDLSTSLALNGFVDVYMQVQVPTTIASATIEQVLPIIISATTP